MNRIFISHSWEDDKISRKLAENLRKDGAEIWIDYGLSAGDKLPEKIGDVIDWCDTLILIWSKKARESHYINLEWQTALNLGKKIITLKIDDTKLPAMLDKLDHVDFKNFKQGYNYLIINSLKLSQLEIESPSASSDGASRGKLKPFPRKQKKDELSETEYYRKPETSKTEWFSKINEEIEKLSFGQVLSNIPKIMKIGKKERIEVRISKDLEADITKKLKGTGTPEIGISKVGEFMKVRLSGDHFKISALNEEEQIVADDTYTEWAWDVVPLKSKIQVLHFHVTIRIKLEGTEEKRDYPVIDKEVYVKVNPVYSTKVFAVNNWKWILTALIIPLVGWIVRMVLSGGK